MTTNSGSLATVDSTSVSAGSTPSRRPSTDGVSFDQLFSKTVEQFDSTDRRINDRRATDTGRDEGYADQSAGSIDDDVRAEPTTDAATDTASARRRRLARANQGQAGANEAADPVDAMMMAAVAPPTIAQAPDAAANTATAANTANTANTATAVTPAVVDAAADATPLNPGANTIAPATDVQQASAQPASPVPNEAAASTPSIAAADVLAAATAAVELPTNPTPNAAAVRDAAAPQPDAPSISSVAPGSGTAADIATTATTASSSPAPTVAPTDRVPTARTDGPAADTATQRATADAAFATMAANGDGERAATGAPATAAPTTTAARRATTIDGASSTTPAATTATPTGSAAAARPGPVRSGETTQQPRPAAPEASRERLAMGASATGPMKIDLSDEGLGPLTLQAHQAAGELHLTLTAGEAATRGLLADHRAALQRELESTGTKVGSLDINQPQNPNSGQAGDRRGNAPTERRTPAQSAAPGVNTGRRGSTSPSSTPSTPTRTAPMSGLDVRI